MYKIWKMFERERVIACDNCMQQTTRKGSELGLKTFYATLKHLRKNAMKISTKSSWGSAK